MKHQLKFSVVIPTRNRETSLRNLLSKLAKQSLPATEIIIVDSSENKHLAYGDLNKSINHIYTNEKSAAKQRNIGMSKLEEGTKFLFFLDDDTSPYPKYFEDMLECISIENAIGVSGLAINPDKVQRVKPSGLLGFLKRMVFLDSKIDGKLLISGVGIPVRERNNGIVEVDWLIGCSCWDFKKIKGLKFEEDFIGHSLGEDVIFSARAAKLGKLVVNSNITLDHLEFSQAKLNIIQYNYMWVYYRFRLNAYVGNKISFYAAFYLSILSKIIFSALYLLKQPFVSIQQISGLTLGLLSILRDIFKR